MVNDMTRASAKRAVKVPAQWQWLVGCVGTEMLVVDFLTYQGPADPIPVLLMAVAGRYAMVKRTDFPGPMPFVVSLNQLRQLPLPPQVTAKAVLERVSGR